MCDKKYETGSTGFLELFLLNCIFSKKVGIVLLASAF